MNKYSCLLLFLIIQLCSFAFSKENDPNRNRAELIKTVFLEKLNSNKKLSNEFTEEYLEIILLHDEPQKFIQFEGSDFFYLIISGSNGVCSYTKLFSFSPLGFRLKLANLSKGCDMHLGSSMHSSSEYRFLDDRTIEVILRIEEVADTNLVDKDGELIGNISFDQVDIIVTEYHNIYSLNNYGDILSYKSHRAFPQTSYKKLQASEISKYQPFHIKIMRNELYADYGYVFKTEEMNKYFREKEWYHPRYEDASEVHELFSEIEKANLDLILKVEKMASE